MLFHIWIFSYALFYAWKFNSDYLRSQFQRFSLEIFTGIFLLFFQERKKKYPYEIGVSSLLMLSEVIIYLQMNHIESLIHFLPTFLLRIFSIFILCTFQCLSRLGLFIGTLRNLGKLYFSICLKLSFTTCVDIG